MAFSPRVAEQESIKYQIKLTSELEEFINKELVGRFKKDKDIQFELPYRFKEFPIEYITHETMNFVLNKFRKEGWIVEQNGQSLHFKIKRNKLNQI